jgi:zinc finger protein GLIS2
MEYSGYSDVVKEVKKELCDITTEHHATHEHDELTVHGTHENTNESPELTVHRTSQHCTTQEDDELIVHQTTEQHENRSDAPELAVHRTTEHETTPTSETPQLTVHRTRGHGGTIHEHRTTEQHTPPECTSEPPQLTVHRIVQTGSHIMHTEDLVQCSTAVIFNDPTVIHSSPSSQSNTLVLTSVFNNTPILAVGESAKTDMSIISKVNPSDLLLPKSEHDDLTNNGSVLLSSPSQTTLLIPSYYHENDHLIQVAPSNVPLYQNTSGSALYGHLAQVHSCQWQDCEEQFLTVEELVDHINNNHVLASKEGCEYSCQWKNCVRRGKGFNARYKLLIHLRTHTGERPHACHFERCDKRFSRLENLKIHCRTHTGEKPYVCPFEGCEKRYSNSSDRFKHTRTHIESKPYRCKVDGCFKQYTDPSSLRKHLKAHKL